MDDRHVVVLDIGATKTLLAIRPVEATGHGGRTVGDVERRETPRDPADLVAWVGSVVETRRATRQPAIVGIAAPGPMDRRSGVLTRAANLGWHDVPIGPLLSARLAMPFVIEDDANAATLGEWSAGAGRDRDPFAYVTWSTGVASGIVVDGVLLRGASGDAGEIGHLVIAPDGPACACGNAGDIESFAGGDAIARRAAGLTVDVGREASRDAAAVFRRADDGDVGARRIVDEAVDAMATLIAVLQASVAPAAIAVGGSIALGRWSLVERATALARQRILADTAGQLLVVPAALGDESVLAGAAWIARAALAE